MDFKSQDISVKIDRTSGEIKFFSDNKEIDSQSSLRIGRIAAQTAKQVIIQKIREAERGVIYQEFKERIGDIANGAVHRFEKGDIIVDLGKTEGMVSRKEQVRGENYRPGDRIRALVVEAKESGKGPQVVLSRTRQEFVKKLFELEVPEIFEGIVEIKSISREAGDRSKVAVWSKDEKVDCVGACVGMRGSRVKNIVKELRGEKIDIVRWNEDAKEYIIGALSPAKVVSITTIPQEKKSEVIVEDDQLSLAIGKHGQNVRLAAQLTGWDIDIRKKVEKVIREEVPVTKLPGVGPKLKTVLEEAGFKNAGLIASAKLEDLVKIKGIGTKTAEKILKAAKDIESGVKT
jgi:N utilization substance protein A